MESRFFFFGLFLLSLENVLSLSDEKSTLTFIVDDTGSMQVDVHELNRTANYEIFKDVDSDQSQIEDFAVVTFNDPEIKSNLFPYRPDFANALSKIQPHGGGNCAEMSLGGIQQGLQKSRDGSLLWVFTDASAADLKLYDVVEDLSQQQRSQIVFAVTGLCNNRTDPDYLVYQGLAIATNGQVFHLRKNEIEKLFHYTKELISNRKDIIASKLFTPGTNNVDVIVDDDIKELIIAVSGEKPVITVTSPDGYQLSTEDITRLNEVSVVKLKTPEHGTYKVEVTSSTEAHVVVSGSTTIHFQHGFSSFAPTVDLAGTTRKPVPDNEAYFSIKLAATDDDDNALEVRSLQILNMDDEILLEEPLAIKNKARQIYSTVKKIKTPKDMFKVAIKLYDTLTKTFLTRHGLTPIKSQLKTSDIKKSPPVAEIIGGPEITAGYYRPLQLKCKIKANPMPTVFWTSEDTATVALNKNQVSISQLPDEYISVLEIPEVKLNATYTCEAENTEGKDSNKVTVETSIEKTFDPIKIPENATINYLSRGKVVCNVEAFPPAKVTWYKKGELLRPDGNIQISADGTLLIIRSMEPYMEGDYNCSVANALDREDFPFTLSISGTERPFIKKTAKTIKAQKYSNADLVCTVIEGKPAPIVHWYFKAGDDFVPLNNSANTIHFDKVDVSQTGTYACLADNFMGSDWFEMDLIVADKCELPADIGPCQASYQKYYYDSSIKQCVQFNYGGCGGNDNRFDSREECLGACPGKVTPAPPTSPTNKCELSVEKGPCTAAYPKYYFDKKLKQCVEFIYGGCFGNENRFNSAEECLSACSEPATPQPPTPPPSTCELPVDKGPCQSSYPKYYYDKTLKQCVKFTYGGCMGNNNRFNTIEDCQSACPEQVAPTPANPPQSTCELPVDKGPCQSSYPKYYYDKTLKQCVKFTYGGCMGNNNRFNTIEDCQSACPEQVAPTPANPPQSTCELPVDKGPCQSSYPKYYYDKTLKQCVKFSYGGCMGNNNRFNTIEDCQSACPEPVAPPPANPPQSTCELPVDKGPCQSSYPKYYYDKTLKQCVKFSYGGCMGNNNRFNTIEDCQSACPEPVAPPPANPPQSKCQQPMTVGPCRGAFKKWYFDNNYQQCRQFTYGGCQGNDNRFDTEVACRDECGQPGTITDTPDPSVCELEADEGTCTNYTEMWRYDDFFERCRTFYYGGCGGNGNRFKSEADCQATCIDPPTTKVAPIIITTDAPNTPIGKCEQPKVVGPCRGSFTKWYYDSNYKQCRWFTYGGCQGNDNRFDSEAACRDECVGTGMATEPAATEPGKCDLPMQAGPCQASLPRWYYDKTYKQCRKFTYGGCGRNANHFSSEEECQGACPDGGLTTPKPTTTTAAPSKCELPADKGPCQSVYWRYYYDANYKACRVFNYGGCHGNANRFETEEECLDECENSVTPAKPITTTPKPGKCEQPMDRGPCQVVQERYYYDASTKTCRKFYYGGCGGNENRFQKEEECRAECGPPSELTRSESNCVLDIKNDLNGNDPLILTLNDQFADLETRDGRLYIPGNQTIKLICSQRFQYLPSLKEIIATCESDNHFLIRQTNRRYAYSNLKCTDSWQYKIKKTGRQCVNTDSELVNVGFERGGILQEVYQVCLNRITNNPIYTKLNMVQSLPNAVANKDTPWFDQETTENYDRIYDCSAQSSLVSSILGKNFHRDEFGCCFEKMTLVNALDVAPGLQASTYLYYNVAPHWSTCNSLNWRDVENRIRDLRRRYGHTIEVWTGVAQDLVLPDARAQPTKIVLSQNGKEFQVPKYFWKIVYDPHTNAAIAIIQVNVPDLHIAEGKNHIRCTDVCGKTTWMKGGQWRIPSRGYTYCCSLEAFKTAFNLRSYYNFIPTTSELLLDAPTPLSDNVL